MKLRVYEHENKCLGELDPLTLSMDAQITGTANYLQAHISAMTITVEFNGPRAITAGDTLNVTLGPEVLLGMYHEVMRKRHKRVGDLFPYFTVIMEMIDVVKT